MRNPMESKTGRRLNGSVAPPEIKVIEQAEAIRLLSKVRRQAIYRPYIPFVIDAIRKIRPEQHIVFHVPVINGKPNGFTAKHLMSVINVALKKMQIQHRLRYVQDDNVLVSEKVAW